MGYAPQIPGLDKSGSVNLAAPGPIGGTTPAAGAFTTLTSSSTITQSTTVTRGSTTTGGIIATAVGTNIVNALEVQNTGGGAEVYKAWLSSHNEGLRLNSTAGSNTVFQIVTGSTIATGTLLVVLGATNTFTNATTLSSTLAVTGATTLTGLLTANGGITVVGGSSLLTTNTSLTNYNGSNTATLGSSSNAPNDVIGEPTKWIAINDNGTTRYIPTWSSP
jgi:fibronectin-binding autotransporter adhesin